MHWLFVFFMIGAHHDSDAATPSSIAKRRMDLIGKFVEEAAARERIDPALIRAIIQVESGFNHKAISRVGAKGLMQLMPPTAEELGSRRALDFRQPKANVLAGTRYLRAMINEFRGDLTLAIAAYNAGPNAVKRYGGIPPFAETQEYVKKVMRIYRGGAREKRLTDNKSIVCGAQAPKC